MMKGFWLLHVPAPRVVTAVLQVIRVALVGIGLALKRDIEVGVAAHRQPHQPLHDVGHIEKDKQQLALLSRVDTFVGHHLITQINARVHKQHTEQIDGRESSERQYRRPDNLHCRKGTTFFPIITLSRSSWPLTTL